MGRSGGSGGSGGGRGGGGGSHGGHSNGGGGSRSGSSSGARSHSSNSGHNQSGHSAPKATAFPTAPSRTRISNRNSLGNARNQSNPSAPRASENSVKSQKSVSFKQSIVRHQNSNATSLQSHQLSSSRSVSRKVVSSADKSIKSAPKSISIRKVRPSNDVFTRSQSISRKSPALSATQQSARSLASTPRSRRSSNNPNQSVRKDSQSHKLSSSRSVSRKIVSSADKSTKSAPKIISSNPTRKIRPSNDVSTRSQSVPRKSPVLSATQQSARSLASTPRSQGSSNNPSQSVRKGPILNTYFLERSRRTGSQSTEYRTIPVGSTNSSASPYAALDPNIGIAPRTQSVQRAMDLRAGAKQLSRDALGANVTLINHGATAVNTRSRSMEAQKYARSHSSSASQRSQSASRSVKSETKSVNLANSQSRGRDFTRNRDRVAELQKARSTTSTVSNPIRITQTPHLTERDHSFNQLRRSGSNDPGREWNRRFEDGKVYVYTDGSMAGGRSGFGIYMGPKHPLNRSEVIVQGRHSPDRAEILAATQALRNIRNWSEYKNEPVVLRTDCLKIVWHIQGKPGGPHWYQECVAQHPAELKELRNEIAKFRAPVVLPHVYAHSDDPGNEASDDLARQATVGPSRSRSSSVGRGGYYRERSRSNDPSHILEYSASINPGDRRMQE